jgi:hypothetical protein
MHQLRFHDTQYGVLESSAAEREGGVSIAMTRGGYELGVTQRSLNEGVCRCYDRQQSDRNLLLAAKVDGFISGTDVEETLGRMDELKAEAKRRRAEKEKEAREISFPLTRAMCAPIGDGSAAAIVASESFLKKHPSSRAIKILASIMQSGSRLNDGDPAERASKMAFEQSGVGPDDIDVMEVHDATAFGELALTERLGLCPEGEGGPFAESGATSLGGKVPVNPSGGLMSRGHPIGASGLAQVYELVTHLRGAAGQRQVAGARIAMAENGGGTIGNGEAAMAIHEPRGGSARSSRPRTSTSQATRRRAMGGSPGRGPDRGLIPRVMAYSRKRRRSVTIGRRGNE